MAFCHRRSVPGPWLRLARFGIRSCFPRPRFRRISRLLRDRQHPGPQIPRVLTRCFTPRSAAWGTRALPGRLRRAAARAAGPGASGLGAVLSQGFTPMSRSG